MEFILKEIMCLTQSKCSPRDGEKQDVDGSRTSAEFGRSISTEYAGGAANEFQMTGTSFLEAKESF